MSDPRLASQIHTLAKLVESAESNYYTKNYKKPVDNFRKAYGQLVKDLSEVGKTHPKLESKFNTIMRVLYEKSQELETVLSKATI